MTAAAAPISSTQAPQKIRKDREVTFWSHATLVKTENLDPLSLPQRLHWTQPKEAGTGTEVIK